MAEPLSVECHRDMIVGLSRILGSNHRRRLKLFCRIRLGLLGNVVGVGEGGRSRPALPSWRRPPPTPILGLGGERRMAARLRRHS